MSKAEELLASLTEEVPVHEHPVTDSDTYFIINPATRKIENTASRKNVLMQFDHKSEVFTFEIPRYVEGHDMMLCNKVYVHWNNIDAKTGEETADVYWMEDLQVNPEKKDTVICTWTPTRNSTQRVGMLSFLVQYTCVDKNGNVTYEWHTDFYEDMMIRKGRKNTEAAIAPYTDILEQWYARLFGIGDSVLADISQTLSAAQQTLQEESASQQSAIEAKGAETLASIPPDYTEMYKMAEEAMRTKADAIVVEAEGETISVSNASDDPLQGLRIFGKTEQVKTTGKNLLDLTVVDRNVGSATLTVNPDKSITLNGTVETNGSVILGKFRHSGEFVISTGISSEAMNSSYLYMTLNNDTNIGWYGKEVPFTHDGTERSLVLVVIAGTYSNVTFYPMIRYSSVEDSTYEPYTGGKPSPNPDWPQELVSVENAEVVVYGKNLLEVSAESETINGVTFTVNENGSVSVNGTATANAFFILKKRVPVVPDETYRMTGCPNGGSLYTYMMYLHNNTTGIDAYDTGDGLTVTPTSDNNNVVIVVYKGVTANNLVFWPMIRVASFADGTFEPYKPVQTLATKRTLNAIGDVKDELVYDYLKDRWQLIQRIGNVTLSSTNPKTFIGSDEYIYYPMANYGVYGTLVYCSHYENIGFNSTGASVKFAGFSTVDEFNNFLSENNVKVVYILTTPIIHDLTTEEVLAFKALRTNKPNTVIQNGVGAYMIAEYNADTEIFLRECQPKPTDTQVENAVNTYFNTNGVQIPSDDHIRSLIDEALGGIVNGEY